MNSITDWIQAICEVLIAISAIVGVFISIPKSRKEINKNVNESADKLAQQWKRLTELYTSNSHLHEYSSIKKNTDNNSEEK